MEGSKHLRLGILVRCGKVYFSFNRISGSFDHQNLWKESIEIKFFYGLVFVLKHRASSKCMFIKLYVGPFSDDCFFLKGGGGVIVR